jgi:CRISPR-associated DxTHG motif protein
LSQRLQGHTQIVEVDIPDGKSEEELWEIFEAISKAVQEGDEIVFDITHGFRSLPMIALLTIAYLKQVKGVKVQHVVYGVYERDNPMAPILDLTPFADLLDWLAAAKMFTATGDSSELGRLIQDVQTTPIGIAGHMQRTCLVRSRISARRWRRCLTTCSWRVCRTCLTRFADSLNGRARQTRRWVSGRRR